MPHEGQARRAGARRLERWPLALLLDQLVGEAGVRLVAIRDRDPTPRRSAGRAADNLPLEMAGQQPADQPA
jgi:hypothetical protein